MAILGLDTSAVAGNKGTNWQKVKAAGYQFVFLRSNYGCSQDTAFAREWPKLKDAGLIRGGYLFWRCGTAAKPNDPATDPVRQAQAMIKTLDSVGFAPNNGFDLPPTLDIEFSGGRAATGFTAKQALDRVNTCWQTLKDRYGVGPVVYTSYRVWRDDLRNLPAPLMGELSPVWVAYWINQEPPVPAPWRASGEPITNGNWWVWQYRGNVDAKTIPGFYSGAVDLNQFHMMMKGDKGLRVKWVQKRVGVAVDGVFGAQTDAAVRKYQTAHGLVADGIIGPKTFAYLSWEA